MGDLDLLINAARAAGEISLGFFQDDPEIWHKDGDQGPVTEADLAVDRMLHGELLAARNYAWLSEETEDDKARLDAEHVFIVDPIDGTRAFIEGAYHWSHSLAVAKGGIVQAAVVYLPAADKLYAAERGKGATLNGAPLRVSDRRDIDGATVLAAKPNLDPWFWKGAKAPPVTRAFRSSLAYRLALVAEGRFDAMMSLRGTWEWDIAAGNLIVEEAGGDVSDRRAGLVRFNNPTPMINGLVAGNPDIHHALVAGLL
ncbi:Inositol-1-monophosphatase [Aliiroseovarius sp. xm-m-379]|uniref:inositol monophosphatase family protein n=1 Tax=unclassified Aliiroseovarius TaxID=2623558 RepID=UPI001568FA63|nr:Inositol-1-monophosphatase [Aliiroseovarius sp. xm-m-379]NRP32023.1 Inositol-1-monophosphatase [Aliiroseovarius sp. xm-m-314]NRP35062.1 Inositol-1-monophosphatase [Aliiroseovarius sp. xm-a-104]NRP45856.1 Inositol-1-monophosphatase [Aliiroseovarius sp. xm-m-378]NRP51331.1 Inositol-1-monophosphatase [Aliiroseovarius sp. xm-m-354]NRP66724.1 Inositol-1-monophosphatase [Aliiroseovarius sp. xm-v-225]NRP81665.1 Inositol-1-monophosphatase [Aliiroseovarius sp. xm-v-209]NRP93750.1 Inositol-1-monoph